MKERRKAHRVSCSISLNYKVLEKQEFTESFDAFSYKRKKMTIYDKLKYENTKLDFKLKTAEHETVNYLMALNTQLGLLTDLLSQDIDSRFEYTQSDIVFSVTGMSLIIKDWLETGVMLEMQLQLSTNTPRILVIAEVISCSANKEEAGFQCAVAFSYIDKEDKGQLEKLVEKN